MIYDSLSAQVDCSYESLVLASAKIDELTFNRINEIGFDNLTPFQREKIEQAAVFQAKYYDTYGTDAGDMKSFSLLDTSISFGDTTETGVPVGVSSSAYMLLKQTGLMCRRL